MHMYVYGYMLVWVYPGSENSSSCGRPVCFCVSVCVCARVRDSSPAVALVSITGSKQSRAVLFAPLSNTVLSFLL